MIEPRDDVFPNNIIKLLSDSAQALDADLFVTGRPLRSSDPLQAVGIFPSMWQPVEASQEMGRVNPGEPTMQTYSIGLQAFVKDGDELVGLKRHSTLSHMLRTMLYRDPAIRVGLPALSYTTGGVTERVMRWGVRNQRFLSNEVTGSWLYLSTLEVWAETVSN